MAPKHLRGAPHVIDPGAAVPPALDLSRRQSEHRAANHRLLARLKALERSQKTQTPRAYARRYGREQESLILGLPLQGTPSRGKLIRVDSLSRAIAGPDIAL